ncbi:MAG TPA: hypothetical protein DDZ51_17655 [Planctomycetaceae bacterium]|nr:hypothetical protein [Planctomycetaceae bacterium]
MANFSESKQPGAQSPLTRAIAYYRQSAQNRQEESLAKQQAQVRQWAAENGVEIIREFFDDCLASIDSDERPAFNEMLDDWIKQRSDFEYVLCLDASRWGRFDCDEQLIKICEQHRKKLAYASSRKLGAKKATKVVGSRS